MRDRPRHPIEFPNGHDVEAPAVRIGHQAIELRTPLLRAGDPDVDVFAGELPAAAIDVLAELARLHRWILAVVCSGNPRVEGGLHRSLIAVSVETTCIGGTIVLGGVRRAFALLRSLLTSVACRGRSSFTPQGKLAV